MENLFGHYMMLNAAQDWFQLGEWDLADARLQVVADRAPTEWNALMRDLVTAHLALGRGKPAEARRATNAAAGLFAKRQPAEFAGEVYAVRAELALLLGEHERARALIQEGLKWAISPGELLYTAPLFALGARVEAELRVVAPQRAAPERASELLGTLDDLLAASTGRPPPTAVAHRTTCLAERRRAEGEADPAAWSRAASAWAALRMPFPAAYARVRQAEAALARDRDLATARSLLSASTSTAHRLGAAPLEELAATVAAQAGMSLDEREPAAPTKPFERAELDLTRRELEVLAPLARGCSNREISEEFVLSPRTVETHVQRIFTKLDVHNRTAATLRAQELGLVGRPKAAVLRFV
jgi:ATP/maltotriose-dependent transcriptional regulator MalT